MVQVCIIVTGAAYKLLWPNAKRLQEAPFLLKLKKKILFEGFSIYDYFSLCTPFFLGAPLIMFHFQAKIREISGTHILYLEEWKRNKIPHSFPYSAAPL